TLLTLRMLLSATPPPPAPPSFPTRRSSDLDAAGRLPSRASRRYAAHHRLLDQRLRAGDSDRRQGQRPPPDHRARGRAGPLRASRSEEHTSELQSLTNLVCRLLLEKKTHTPH